MSPTYESAPRSTSKGTDATESPTSSARMAEWSAARSNIERFDGYLNDLRKYGFGLVTSLLAVTGYLSSSSATSLSDATKLAVSASILALVVALAFLDGQYRSLQRGATIRARILEKYLNLDLTGAMALYARLGRFAISYVLVYELTASAVYVLGVGVLWGAWLYELVWIPVFLVVLALVAGFGSESLVGTFDWSVDAKIVRKGQPVRVTFTNLREMRSNEWLWVAGKIEGVGHPYSQGLPRHRLRVRFMHDANWLWPTDDPEVVEGLYRVVGFWWAPPESPESEVTPLLPSSGHSGTLRAEEETRNTYAHKGPALSGPPPSYREQAFSITIQVVGSDASARP